MAEDLDLELAAAKAKARKRKELEQRETQATEALGQRPGAVSLPRGSDEFLGPASMSGTALRSFGEGASLGFEGELSGLARGAVMAGGELAGKGLSLINEPAAKAAVDELGQRLGVDGASAMSAADAVLAAYRKGRQESDLERIQGRRANPATAIGSELAGGLMAPVPPAARAPGAKVGERMVQLGKQGAKVGAAAALGNSDADLTKGEFVEAAKDTAGGAALGATLGAAMGPAEYVWARKVQPALATMARERAVSAITPTAGLANRLKREGYVTPDEVEELGENVLRAGVLRPFGTVKGAQERNLAILDEQGQAIGEIVQNADDLVAKGVAAPPSLGKQISSTLQALRDTAAESTTRQSEAQKIGPGLLERVGVGQNRPTPSFGELWQTKRELQSALRPDEVSNLGQKVYRKGVAGYTRGVYDQLEGAVGPDEAAKLKAAAEKYGRSAEIATFLDDAATRAQQRQPVGLTDMLRGQQVGDALGGGAGMIGTLVSALVRGRLDSTLATGARALSRNPANASPFARGAGAYLSPTKPAAEFFTSPKLSEEEDVAVRAFMSGG